MTEGVDYKLSVELKVFSVKTFYETSNKRETCRCSLEKFNRRTTRETVDDTVKRFEESETVAEKKRSGRLVVIRTEENKATVKSVFSKYPSTSRRHRFCEYWLAWDYVDIDRV